MDFRQWSLVAEKILRCKVDEKFKPKHTDQS